MRGDERGESAPDFQPFVPAKALADAHIVAATE
jgi:hypothetical protein